MPTNDVNVNAQNISDSVTDKNITTSNPAPSTTEKTIMAVSVGAATILASYALMKRGNYRVAFLFYNNKGGAGVNLYKQTPTGSDKRIFAIDYHKNPHGYALHYHRGSTAKEIREHRPWQGRF